MSGAGIAILVNGKMTDLSEIDWFLIAPCGCTAGATVGYMNAFGHVTSVTTAQQADESFHETADERAKYQRLGFTIEPGLRSEVMERMKSSCPHDPKWGYSISKPDGWVWACHFGKGRLHLVPNEAVEDGSRDKVTALCKRAHQYSWTAERHWTMGLVECATCEARADALVGKGALV